MKLYGIVRRRTAAVSVSRASPMMSSGSLSFQGYRTVAMCNRDKCNRIGYPSHYDISNIYSVYEFVYVNMLFARVVCLLTVCFKLFFYFSFYGTIVACGSHCVAASTDFDMFVFAFVVKTFFALSLHIFRICNDPSSASTHTHTAQYTAHSTDAINPISHYTKQTVCVYLFTFHFLLLKWRYDVFIHLFLSQIWMPHYPSVLKMISMYPTQATIIQ